jgi:hypothetical protein
MKDKFFGRMESIIKEVDLGVILFIYHAEKN